MEAERRVGPPWLRQLGDVEPKLTRCKYNERACEEEEEEEESLLFIPVKSAAFIFFRLFFSLLLNDIDGAPNKNK